MRVLRAVLAVVLLTATIILPSTASAETLTAGGQLHINAEVRAKHTVIVDQARLIQQIFSNTAEPTENVRVYVDSNDIGNEMPLTDAIFEQYQQLVPAGQSRIGTLYDRQLSAFYEVPIISPFTSILKATDTIALR
jgi:hypothetical protein